VQPVAVEHRAAPPAAGRARPAWWTDADQAELECLLRELVDGVFEHRERCERCLAGYPPCPHVGRAIEVVLDWREARELFSKARWLRWQQELLDFRRDVARHRRAG
jgi:hypothetical protein